MALADWLIEKRVKAAGIDSLSVDSLDSSENEVDKKLLQNELPSLKIFRTISDSW